MTCSCTPDDGGPYGLPSLIIDSKCPVHGINQKARIEWGVCKCGASIERQVLEGGKPLHWKAPNAQFPTLCDKTYHGIGDHVPLGPDSNRPPFAPNTELIEEEKSEFPMWVYHSISLITAVAVIVMICLEVAWHT